MKNNKTCGIDGLINDFFKSSQKNIINIYTKLFNLVFQTGIVPDAWTLGIIKPLYEQKGDKSQPENYRGITLISCFGKLFTSILNNRLTKYVENNNILGEDQAGFRQGYGVSDHIFVLKHIIDIYLFNRRKLYCAFIDYKAAYDKIDRVLVWGKLLKSGINGSIFKVIFNMYSEVKSCIQTNGQLTEYFSCGLGLRQGENLSPILFALFVNDLKEYLPGHFDGLTLQKEISAEISNNLSSELYNIFLLMYADDTVILAESPEQLQLALNKHCEYCRKWNLTVNASKTKVMLFSRGKCKYDKLCFKYGNGTISVIEDYVYLGVKFSYNAKFIKAYNYTNQKGNKTLFAMLRKARQLNLPLDLTSQLFDSVVLPVLMYGGEVLAAYPSTEIEKVHLKFCKYLLSVPNTTTSAMVYAELGRMPLEIKIKTKALFFWSKLVTGKQIIIYYVFFPSKVI